MSTPVAPAKDGRRGLWRWSIAFVATVALVVSGSGLVVFAQSGGGESEGPVFVPADYPIYLEARLDMPEGQGEALAQMMTAFPGFNDPGTFFLAPKISRVHEGQSLRCSLDKFLIDDYIPIVRILTASPATSIDFDTNISKGSYPAVLVLSSPGLFYHPHQSFLNHSPIYS